MPRRRHPLVTGFVYHVINRGLNKQGIFVDDQDRHHLWSQIDYLSYSGPKPSYSRLAELSVDAQQVWLDRIKKQPKLVEIFVQCFLPNHLHLVVQQASDFGVQRFAHDVFDSYTRYFNTKHNRSGALFGGRFRSVHVETDDQLLQVCRYGHLNPYSHQVVKSLTDLKKYRWSNLPAFLDEKQWKNLPNLIRHRFKGPDDYWRFLADRADYQRQLDEMKQLFIE